MSKLRLLGKLSKIHVTDTSRCHFGLATVFHFCCRITAVSANCILSFYEYCIDAFDDCSYLNLSALVVFFSSLQLTLCSWF